MRSVILAAYACVAVACSASTEDPSLFLTGTEEFAVQTADGTFICQSPTKVLLCHIPPGNPDNAHTICVGAAAVEPHVRLHGDHLGACNAPDGGIGVDAGIGGDAGIVSDGGVAPDASVASDAGLDAGAGADAGSIE